MASEHIYKQFDSDLEAIRAKVLEMGTLVEEQTANAVKSLLNTDIKLAEQVMKRDDQINDLEVAIDEETSLLIAKRSPAAGDLRNIMMMLKIITDLERMGDEAAKIARSTTRIFEDNRMSKPRFTEIKGMAKAVQGMIKTALNSFARLDLSDTIDILEKDKQVDDEIKKVEHEIEVLKKGAPEKINKIAIETSSELVKKLIGADVNNSSISAIVDDLSKRNGDKYYGN